MASASSTFRFFCVPEITPPVPRWPGVTMTTLVPQRGHLVHDLLLRPGRQRQGRNDRPDADDDPEHGQKRAELVGRQAAQGKFHYRPEDHWAPPALLEAV